MLKTYNIKSYALIVGLATVLCLPITAVADQATDDDITQPLNAQGQIKAGLTGDSAIPTPSGLYVDCDPLVEACGTEWEKNKSLQMGLGGIKR